MRAALLLCCALASLAIVAGATCPSSGIICTSQCSTTFQQCTSSQTYPAQAVAPGTVCCNGAFVYPNDPCCSGATTAAPTTTKAPATSAPTTKAPTTSAPTTKAPTTAASTTKAPTTQAATTTSGTSTLSQIFTQADWNTLFPNANLAANRGDAGQYPIFTYSNLINAAAAYPAFASVGTTAQRKRELAAFLAQTSQETSGWWSGQDYIWGYVYSTELCGANCNVYCGSSTDYPCVSGQNYNGRGPIQISWNYNYGPASAAILGNKNTLLNNPNLVLTDGVVAYKTALWFWMTTQSPKPSCHDVMTGAYTPTAADTSAGRVAGFGLVTDIINGGIECNTGATPSPQSVNRVGYYNKYTNYFGVSDTSNLYCNNMKSY